MEPTTTKMERALAVAGWVWIPLLWILVMGSGEFPAAWGWAFTFYGAYGLYECTATLSDKREAWARNLKIARYISLGFAFVAAVYLLTAYDGR